MRNGFETNIGFFVVGALLGGAVAAMTTPYTGSRMRRIVRHKVEDSSDHLAEAAARLRETCDELYARSEKFLHEAGKKVARVPIKSFRS